MGDCDGVTCARIEGAFARKQLHKELPKTLMHASFPNGSLVTTDMAAASYLLTTIVYQEKTPPSLIRLGGISLDIQLW